MEDHEYIACPKTFIDVHTMKILFTHTTHKWIFSILWLSKYDDKNDNFEYVPCVRYFPSILSHFTIRKQRLRGLKYLAYSHRAGEKVEVDFDYSSVHIPEQLCPYSRTHVLEPAPTGFWEPSIDYTSQSCHWQLFGGTWNWTWQGYLNHENWQIHQIKTPPPHQSQMTI